MISQHNGAGLYISFNLLWINAFSPDLLKTSSSLSNCKSCSFNLKLEFTYLSQWIIYHFFLFRTLKTPLDVHFAFWEHQLSHPTINSPRNPAWSFSTCTVFGCIPWLFFYAVNFTAEKEDDMWKMLSKWDEIPGPQWNQLLLWVPSLVQ